MADTECEPWHSDFRAFTVSLLTLCVCVCMLFTFLSFTFPDGKAEVLYIIMFIKALRLEAQ